MKSNARILALGLACASFLALGVLTAAIGPALADLAGNTGVSLAAVGGIFTALFLGALVSQGLAGPTMDRLGPRPVLWVGLILVGLGTLGVTWAPWLWLALALAVVTGLGHGSVDVTSNVMVAELFPERRAAAVNLLNVFFGIGAFLGPAIAGLALGWWQTALPALWLGAGLLLLLALPMAAWAPRGHIASQTGPAAGPAAKGKTWLASPLLWGLGALILVYVGIENGVGGWTPLYLEQTVRLDPAKAALVTSGFWLALTAGRVMATLVGTRISAKALLAGSLGIALLGSLLLAAGQGNLVTSIAAILVLGFGFGPVFPTSVALTTASFPGSAGAAAGVVVASGSLGGMLIPWIQGILLERTGPPGSLALTVGATLAMLALYFIYRRYANLRRVGDASAAVDPTGQSPSQTGFPTRAPGGEPPARIQPAGDAAAGSQYCVQPVQPIQQIVRPAPAALLGAPGRSGRTHWSPGQRALR